MSEEKLVKMEKEGVVLEVHPDAVAEHAELGWQLAQPDAKPTKLAQDPEPDKDDEPTKPKGKGK